MIHQLFSCFVWLLDYLLQLTNSNRIFFFNAGGTVVKFKQSLNLQSGTAAVKFASLGVSRLQFLASSLHLFKIRIVINIYLFGRSLNKQ